MLNGNWKEKTFIICNCMYLIKDITVSIMEYITLIGHQNVSFGAVNIFPAPPKKNKDSTKTIRKKRPLQQDGDCVDKFSLGVYLQIDVSVQRRARCRRLHRCCAPRPPGARGRLDIVLYRLAGAQRHFGYCCCRCCCVRRQLDVCTVHARWKEKKIKLPANVGKQLAHSRHRRMVWSFVCPVRKHNTRKQSIWKKTTIQTFQRYRF